MNPGRASLVLLVCFASVACARGDATDANDPTGAPYLPATADVVVGLSFAHIRASRALAPLVSALRDRARPLLQQIQQECHLDPLLLVDRVVFASDGIDRGFSLALVRGRFTEGQVDDCVMQLARADVGRVVRARKHGRVTSYEADGERDQLHVAWLGQGHVLIPLAHMTDRAWLEDLLREPRRLSSRPDALALLRAASSGATTAGWAVALEDPAGEGVPTWLADFAPVVARLPVPRDASLTLDLAGSPSLRGRLRFGAEGTATASAAAIRAFTPMGARAQGLTVELEMKLEVEWVRKLIATL